MTLPCSETSKPYLLVVFTSDCLASEVKKLVGEGLHFYDASAPIIDAQSIDMNSAFVGDRYN